MVLFPLDSTPVENRSLVPAWQAVAERQHAPATRFLLVQQPDHARVSGAISRAMTAAGLPILSADVILAIELHDQGWKEFDSHPATSNSRPRSFIDVEPPDFLAAWAESIHIAENVSPIAGYMISSHFRWLAEFRLRTVADPPEIYEPLDDFAMRERRRSADLLAADGRTASAAGRLVGILQFCDLLSLYLCSGATRPASFPQAIFDNVDLRVTIQQTGEGCFALTPSPFTERVTLQTEAAGYPSNEQSRTLRWALQ